ncbi:DUF2254 domain-containing protein [uncultured Sunxiuqinia sp.]|uniref:DUF2254 domain-containing protein n=1 Tax=uncultured Sunxiuqinia sp. TaxID=1573825 RepID=UPI002AA66A66|nr:DUF2254 domain-containing protein [uncultured Sunxiuqinia sp.]
MRIGFKFIKTRLSNNWEAIHTSFWFIPSLMLLSSIVAALFMIAMDKTIDVDSSSVSPILFDVGPEGARSVLATIAGSMVTVAGVAFSITIVALSLASSQFGPRLLRNFMKDVGNQVALGTFIATFIYCLIVLRSIYAGEEHAFVPVLSVNFGVLLAIGNVGMFIYFIHHVATSIQADQVVANVYHELDNRIDLLFPNTIEDPKNEDKALDVENEKQKYTGTYTINAQRSGYLQAIDHERLIEAAQENDCLVDCQYRPGDFIVQGNQFVTVKSMNQFDDEFQSHIGSLFIIGAKRTPEQDAEFAIHQLVEVAIRALSPGINDPYTALTCIDHLGSILCKLVNRKFPSPHLKDEEGRLRVILKTTSFTSITNTAFSQIRQYGSSHVSVLKRLLETLITMATLAQQEEQSAVIQHHGEMIERAVRKFVSEKDDQEEIIFHYRELMHVLDQEN